MALDGTTLEAADTPANRAGLSGPKPKLRGQGPVGYPAARLAVLIESGTHTVVDAEAGPWSTGERALAEPLLRSLRPGMLLLADRGFPGVTLMRAMAGTGTHLLWRVNGLWKLAPEQVLADGSWLSTARHDTGPRKDRGSIRLRVVEYVLDDPGRDHTVHYRLVTV
ncbi:transposase [Streptomyces olivoreticuli]